MPRCQPGRTGKWGRLPQEALPQCTSPVSPYHHPEGEKLRQKAGTRIVSTNPLSAAQLKRGCCIPGASPAPALPPSLAQQLLAPAAHESGAMQPSWLGPHTGDRLSAGSPPGRACHLVALPGTRAATCPLSRPAAPVTHAAGPEAQVEGHPVPAHPAPDIPRRLGRGRPCHKAQG